MDFAKFSVGGSLFQSGSDGLLRTGSAVQTVRPSFERLVDLLVENGLHYIESIAAHLLQLLPEQVQVIAHSEDAAERKECDNQG